MAGLVVVILGVVLLLDALGAFTMRLAAFVPLALGAVGAVLLVTGLGRRG